MITTSTSVRGAIDGVALSNVTRTGMAGAARTLTREAAADGITGHNVLAAPILTDCMRALLAAEPDLHTAIAARGARNPSGRVGDPAREGDRGACLASNRAAFITGLAVFMDGGERRVVG